MLRSFLRSNKNLRRIRVSSLPRAYVVVQQPLLSVYVYQRICLFSTSEAISKILASEDVKEMLEEDLKTELERRGVSMEGNKMELLQRLTEILEKEKSGSENSQPAVPQTRFVEDLQNLDTSLSEKNFQLFEEIMKEMETAIRSNSELFLTAEQKNFLSDKLRIWSEVDGIPSESIASVLKSAGYFGLSVRSGDQNTQELVNSIIDKYLKQDSKSTRSIAIFFTALNKVDARATEMKPEIEDQCLVLIGKLIEANDLDLRSYCESLAGLAILGMNWRRIPITSRLKCLTRLEEMKPRMDITACYILVKSLSRLTQRMDSIISGLAIEGLQLIADSSSSGNDDNDDSVSESGNVREIFTFDVISFLKKMFLFVS
jgi:hypothetical protein